MADHTTRTKTFSERKTPPPPPLDGPPQHSRIICLQVLQGPVLQRLRDKIGMESSGISFLVNAFVDDLVLLHF